MEAEQVELDAEPPVIALLRLLAAPEELVELLLRLPDRAVDPLEHRPLLVAAPVGARHGEQLERPDRSRRVDVGSLAQVGERAVLVEGRHRERLAGVRRPAREIVEDLDLVGLAGGLGARPRLVERALDPDERVVGRHARAHALLDRREVVRRQGARQLEVVVEAVSDRRADPELRAGEHVEHGLGHHVGGRVAHRVDRRMGARVEQLVRRAAVRRLECEVLVVADRHGGHLRFVCHGSLPLRNRRPPRPPRDERAVRPPAVPPDFATRPGGGRALWDRANGRSPDRFAGRSRVVPRGWVVPRLPAVAAALWSPCPRGASRSTRCDHGGR